MAVQNKILVGGISPEGESILNKFLEAKAPDVIIEPIKPSGVKGTLKRKGSRADVLLIILEDSLYNKCKKDVSDVLSSPKVHHYINDEGLLLFLTSKFGKLEGVSVDTVAEHDSETSLSITDSDFVPEPIIVDKSDEIKPQSEQPVSTVSIESTPPVANTEPVQQIQPVQQVQPEPQIQPAQQVQPEPQIQPVQQVQPESQIQSVQKVQLAKQPESTVQTDVNKVADNVISGVANSDMSALIEENKNLANKLTQLEMVNRNLVRQIDGKSTSSNIESLVNKIKELTESLNSKDDEINQLRLGAGGNEERSAREVTSLKAELRKTKEVLSEVEYSKSSLEREVTASKDEIKKLNDRVVGLEEEQLSLNADLDSLKDENVTLIERNNKLKTENEEYLGKTAEMTILQERADKLDVVSVELETTKSELRDKKLEANNLSLDNTKLRKDIEESKSKLADLNDLLSTRNTRIAELTDSITENKEEINKKNSEIYQLTQNADILNRNIEKLTKDLEGYQSRNESLVSESTTLRSQIDDLNDQLSDLNIKLNDKESEIARLQVASSESSDEYKDKIEQLQKDLSELNEKDNQIISLNNDINRLNEKVKELQKSIEEHQINEDSLRVDIETKQDEFELLNIENTRLSARIEKLESSRKDLQAMLKESKNSDSFYEEFINSELNDKVSDLTIENEKLHNEITKLKEDNRNNQSASDRIVKLERELDSEKQTNAKLEAELKAKIDDIDSSDVITLKGDIEKTKKEFKEYKKTSVSKEEYERLKQEFDAKVEAYNNLESELLDEQAMIDDYEDNVFIQFADTAMPKYGMPVSLQVPNRIFNNCFCTASGSSESVSTIYKTIRKTFELDKRRSYLILELGIESTIDRDLGVAKFNTPISWLTGNDDIRMFIQSTRYPNVRALTISNSYFNDLYLMNVDWVERLNEISQLANVVIINIGCLSSVITKVLLNSFSKCMRTYVLTKATPINLRTVTMNMTGIVNLLSSVELICYDFDSTTSQSIFNRIQQKYRSRILNGNDVLTFS